MVNQTQNFAWVCIIMLIIIICLVIESKSLKLKSTIKMLTYQLNFALELFLIVLVLPSLEGKCIWFPIDFNFIDKSDKLKIHKYLMNNNNIK